MATGTAFSSGSIPKRNNYGGSSVSSSSSSSSSSGSSNSSSSSSTSQANEEAEEFEETLDWIEILLDRIERAISRLDLKAKSVFKNWSTRTTALYGEMNEVTREINLQQQAYDRYMQQARSVGLSSSWMQKVQDGSIDIQLITDEDLNEKISEYKEW